MKTGKTLVVFFLLCSFSAFPLNIKVQTDLACTSNTNSPDDSVSQQKRVYLTTRITTPPVIDGKLNDSCWNLGQWQSDYTQYTPVYKAKSTYRTEIKILYDDKNVYAAIRSYDDMSKVTQRLGRRDNFAGDMVGICFDSYFDRRSAFEFDLTSAGQKVDLWISNDGWDVNWNAVWYGKVAKEDSAWTAEFKIPLSQLRYGSGGDLVWGLNSWRLTDRIQEETHWNLVANDGTGLVYTYGEMHGLKGLKKAKRIEFIPYLSGNYTTSEPEPGNPFADGTQFNGLAGLDAKIGITNNFTLDATINPDFGQVEADPSVMNLSAFETYFEEKRPFFVEGKNFFDFTFDKDLMFYSRRIGHRPSYTPAYDTISMPEFTTIAGAFKLSGKTSDGLSIGIIESVGAREMASIHYNNQDFKQVAEPLTNYFAGRFQKDFDKGNTIIGGILTQTHRVLTEDYLNNLATNALSYGLEFTRYWKDRKYFFEVKAIGSSINGNNESINKLCTSPARYYKRPDDTGISYDTASTVLNGIGASVKIGKWSKGHWRYNEELNLRSPGLELNDLGYMTISNILKNNTTVSYFETKNQGILKNYSLSLLQQNAWDTKGNSLFSLFSLSGQSEFMNGYTAQLSAQYKFRTIDEWVLRGGPAMRMPDLPEITYLFQTNKSKKLIFGINGNYGTRTDGNSYYYLVSPQLSYRPWPNLVLSLQPSYQNGIDELQYLSTFENQGNSSTYLLGTINNQNLSFTFRMDLAITPELTIQYYGSPFVSIGKYYDFKKITAPLDDTYSNRFTILEPVINGNSYNFDENNDGVTDFSINNPDFNFHQFRSNLVLRWEYKAGSTFYLVWAQDRTAFEQGGSFDFNQGYNNMFDIYPTNIFMIKFNYWFSL